MRIKLYKCFEHWYHGGTIWIISDTHFQKDTEMEEFFEWPAAEERLARINKCVTKNDTLICLGDVGDRLDLVSKIKCNYKVLITGNHDAGNANYTRRILECGICYSEQEAKDILRHGNVIHTLSIGNVNPDSYEKRVNIHGKEFYLLKTDNRLFDEIYDGPLFINDKLLLSHEKIELPFVINIHGHHHCAEKAICQNDLGGYNINCACDMINFTPVRLDTLLTTVPQNKVKSIHDITIEKAMERKK